MEIDDPYTITIRFDQPFVTFGNRVTHGLFASVAYIQSKQYIGDRRGGESGAPSRGHRTMEIRRARAGRSHRLRGGGAALASRASLQAAGVPEGAGTGHAHGDAPCREHGCRRGRGGPGSKNSSSVGIRTLLMPNAAWVWVVLGGQWPTKPTYDPTVPWAAAGGRTGHTRYAWRSTWRLTSRPLSSRSWGGWGPPLER